MHLFSQTRGSFFFSDQDNWGKEIDGRTHNFDLNYDSYRIGPILFDESSPEFKKFIAIYNESYPGKPLNMLTYLTYYTLMSAIDALQQFSTHDPNKSMREKVLYSYLTALKQNKNWYRSLNFGIYQLTSRGETLVVKLPLSVAAK